MGGGLLFACVVELWVVEFWGFGCWGCSVISVFMKQSVRMPNLLLVSILGVFSIPDALMVCPEFDSEVGLFLAVIIGAGFGT